MKYKWIVDIEPSGRYRSFEKRGFPSAEYENGQIAAHMVCEDRYIPSDVKIGKHKLITLRIADHSFSPWKWRKLVGQFKTVQDAKNAFARILIKHPEIMPISSGLPKHLSF